MLPHAASLASLVSDGKPAAHLTDAPPHWNCFQLAAFKTENLVFIHVIKMYCW